MSNELIMHVLRSPHITEKTANLSEKAKEKQIAFKVKPDATKQQVKSAVEALFNVKVSSVRTLNYEGKHCRYRQRAGKHSDWKKAYVTLKEGYDIHFGGE